MAENPGEKAGELTPQEHGGAIYQGAPRNPAPGPGRPSSELRRRLCGSFDKRIEVLTEIADDEEARASDRLRAIDLLAKYGLGSVQEVSVGDVKARLARTMAVIRDRLPEEEALALLEEIRPIWK